MCLGYTAKSRDCQYCVIVIALCPSYCDIVLFLFVLLLFAGLLVAKTGLRCGPRALLDPSPKQGITKALWSIQRNRKSFDSTFTFLGQKISTLFAW